MVTFVPPAAVPLVGDSFVTVGGGGGVYSKWSPEEGPLVPSGVVTVTSTDPTVPAGLTAVIEVVGDFGFGVSFVALAVPNFTAVAPERLVPVIVTFVPPAAEPLTGDSLVTVGAREEDVYSK